MQCLFCFLFSSASFSTSSSFFDTASSSLPSSSKSSTFSFFSFFTFSSFVSLSHFSSIQLCSLPSFSVFPLPLALYLLLLLYLVLLLLLCLPFLPSSLCSCVRTDESSNRISLAFSDDNTTTMTMIIHETMNSAHATQWEVDLCSTGAERGRRWLTSTLQWWPYTSAHIYLCYLIRISIGDAIL